jgi:hypothetical protein
VNQLYTVIYLLIILLIVGVLIDNKAFVCLFVIHKRTFSALVTDTNLMSQDI